MGTLFLEAAGNYFNQFGWVSTPLRKDQRGYPKIPMEKGWQQTPADWKVISQQAWGRAEGIGIVLGPVSGNLACVDLDDAEAAASCHLYAPLRGSTRMVKTARNRAHIYVIERYPTLSSKSFKVLFMGREIQVELKSRGTQVAAVPSPGYELIGTEQPWLLDNVELCWRLLADYHLGIEEQRSTTNYPRPWKDHVSEGERNNTAYIEAHQLREAGVQLKDALHIMRVRVEGNYIDANGMNWQELEKTIRSAYSKGVVNKFRGGVDLSIE